MSWSDTQRAHPRFGFSAELVRRFRVHTPGAGAVWVALELVPGALDGIVGPVRYTEAFEVGS